MADQPLGIQIDDDWKRQAQEEKRKLAEQAAARAAPAGPTAPTLKADPAARPERAAPTPSFAGLVRSIMTQTLLYLGDLAVRGGESHIDLDMARYQIDLLGILEEKTRGNLSVEEQKLLDLTLYDLRARFVSVAGQYVM
jgi:hypothetical protein